MMTDIAPAITAGRDRLDRRPNGRPLLACYFTLGDPVFDDAMRDLYADGGVDILELGIPTTAPYLDGADIAGTMAQALASGADPYRRLADLLDWLAASPERPAGVCMAYPDLDVTRLTPAVLDRLDGLLIVGREQLADANTLDERTRHHGVRECGLVPLGHDPGLLTWARNLNGYVMMQAAAGVTGPRETLDPRLGETIARLRRDGIRRPILAGFGIGTGRQARDAVNAGADGVVIGSMCVRKAAEDRQAIQDFLHEVRSALDD